MLYSKHIEKNNNKKQSEHLRAFEVMIFTWKRLEITLKKKNSGPIQFNLFNPKYEKFP